MTTLPLRTRRHQQAIKDRDRLERQRDEALDKLTRIAAKLKAARKTVERYERMPKASDAPVPLPMSQPLDRAMIEAVTEAIGHPPVNPVKADDGIPDFLRRTKPDAVGAALAIEIEDKRKAKARGRIEKMKAKQRGDLKRMPLTGRAALEAIRG